MIIECCGCRKKQEFSDSKKAWMAGWNFVNDKLNHPQTVCDTCNVDDALAVVYSKAKTDAFFNILNTSK
jgi:hypothetical protein